MSDDRVLILSGAGLSSLLKLPMTNEFKSLIDSSIVDKQTANIIRNYLGEGFNDIEQVMYAMEEFVSQSSGGIAKHILLSDSYLGMDPSGQARNKINTINHNIRTSLSNLKSGIYEILENFDQNESASLYFNIISDIKREFPSKKIVFFTTNYDLSFEKSLRINKKRFKDLGFQNINFGFKDEYGALAYDNSAEINSDAEILDYYKLHGSLDWHYDQDLGCTKAGTNINPRDPNSAPLLYPGFKGLPTKEPFVHLHKIFRDNLHKSSYVIAIGFAFRDPYINEIIRYSHNEKSIRNFYYFNPKSADQLPEESCVPEFQQIFGTRFKYIESKVTNTENPFGKNWK